MFLCVLTLPRRIRFAMEEVLSLCSHAVCLKGILRMTKQDNNGTKVLKASLKAFHRNEIWFCTNNIDSVSSFLRLNGIVRNTAIGECPFAGYWTRILHFPCGDEFFITNKMLFGNYKGKLLLLDESIITDARMSGIMTRRHFLPKNSSSKRLVRKSWGVVRSVSK